MGTGIAIVAIPRKDDYVWRISSEKVPHQTILFLGDISDNATLVRIEEYLGHAVETSLDRFGMEVDHRGELGIDQADVLFFGDHNRKKLERFRGYLLANPDISLAYNSTAQFPSWTPHLTLGYPKTPANPDKRDYPGISWVNFDRIALWTGDFSGPEFLLSDTDFREELLMGEESVNDILAHVGVKGMHWGVHKNTAITIGRAGGKAGAAIAGARGTKTQTKKIYNANVKNAGGLHAVSDKELKSMLARLDMEAKYHKIVNEDAAKRAKGLSATLKFLGTVGKIAVPVLLSGVVIKTAAAHPDKAFYFVDQARRAVTGGR